MSFFSRFLLIYLNNDDPFFIGAFQSNFEYYFVFADTRQYIRTHAQIQFSDCVT